MIRECTETDREILGGYLEEDSYGQAIFHLIDEFGFEQKCFLPGLLFFYAKKEEHHEIKSQGTGKTDASYGR